MVDEYYKLNDDLKNVEAMRRGAENLMRGITPEREINRMQGIEL